MQKHFKFPTAGRPKRRREKRENRKQERIIKTHHAFLRGSLVAQTVRICLQCRRPRFDPQVGKIPWRREWQPTPVILPGEFHRQKSLVAYSPRDHKESDTTEPLTHTCFPKRQTKWKTPTASDDCVMHCARSLWAPGSFISSSSSH